MTIIRRPSPFGELVSLRQAMDRLFEDSFVRTARPWLGASWDGTLPVDVRHDRDELTVEAALPGVKPEDVEITIEEGTLTIRVSSKSERREEQGEYLLQEIRRGEASRSLTLPSGLEPDKATATFENGILTLRIPRAEAVKPRQIRITPTGDGSANAPDTPDQRAGKPAGKAA